MSRSGLVLVMLLACNNRSAAPVVSSEPAKDKKDSLHDRDDRSGPKGEPSKPTTGMPGRGVMLDLDGNLEIATGAIDKDVVRRVVKDHTTKLQFCYEKTLLANPGIEGKVVATFSIAAEGSVDNVKANGVHPDVESCVADTVKAFKFPPSGKKVDVSYPFTFKPA